MTTKAIREKLMKYISSADDKKVKAMYTLLQEEIEPSGDEWDEAFKEELKRRTEAFKNGTAKTYSWEETKQAAIDSYALKAK